MSFLAALYAALMLILNLAALHHPHPRPHARLVLPDVPTHDFSALPQLQPPPPRGFDSGTPQQPETNHGQNHTAPERQLGTQAFPLIVKIEGPIEQEVGPTQNKPQTGTESTTDWVAVFTAGLIVVGILQLIVFGLQAFFLNRTIGKMDEIATAQKADTGDLIAATQNLVTANEAQERAIQRHADIAEQSLTANRHFVFFYGFQGSQIPHKNALKHDDPIEWDDIDYVFRLQFSTPYTLVNQGRTVATVHDIWLALRVLSDLPVIPDADYETGRQANIAKPKVPMAMVIPNVPFVARPVEIDPPIDDTAQIRRILEGRDSYYLYGFVRYSDIITGYTY
jgi:hypothetical protein